jgi:DNA-directed RNA polymerase subunit F
MATKMEVEPVVEEDATELRFGKDFDNADALLISEVKMLLEHRKAQHESQDDDDDQDLSEVFTKTLDYCQTFSKYNSRETISAVRGALQKHKLHKFEVASLANLAPADADEGKSLLPR